MEIKALKDLNENRDPNEEIIINAWTKIYAWWKQVIWTYYLFSEKGKINETSVKKLDLLAYKNIEFKEDIVLTGLNESVYIELDEFITISGANISNYINKPLFPWTKIIYKKNEVIPTSEADYIEINYYDGSSLDIDFSKTKYYELYDLWNESDWYVVRTQILNDFYYAKIRSFNKDKLSTYSNQILLSPQKESDTSAPELSEFDIKIPVYQIITKDITEYIYENWNINTIKNIFIDFDLKTDTDWDWNILNDKDFALDNVGTWIIIKKIGNKVSLELWKFDELVNKDIRFYIIDQNDNIWYKDIKFEVYSPIPNIETISGNIINWKLDEPLTDEPVNLYRVRWWSITKLQDINGSGTINTIENWIFSFDWGSSSGGYLELKNSWSLIAKISEETWKIDVLAPWYSITVYPSNNTSNNLAYPKILLKDINSNLVYFQYLVAPNIWKVEIITDFDQIVAEKAIPWVYYKHSSSSYSIEVLPSGIPNNSWDAIIYSNSNVSKTPIISIFKDWRINMLDWYALEYNNYNYVIFDIKQWGIIIWQVMIIPEKNYIMR